MIAFAISQNFLTFQSHAISNTNDLKDIGFNEKLESSINLDTIFTDQDGNTKQLKYYFQDEKPVILSLVYFKCPRVCTFATDGVLEVLNELESLKLGDDFKVLTISFNPEEGNTIAVEKSELYRNKLSKSQIEGRDNWHFLTGNPENILKLTDSAGFNFKKDGEEFAHPSGLVIITPDGKISRYLYGIQHNARDMKLSLIEAADGNIGPSNALNKVLLFCYQFDPIGKRYALRALNVVKAGGMITLATLVAFLAVMWKREKK